jgi:hypothetical protein
MVKNILHNNKFPCDMHSQEYKCGPQIFFVFSIQLGTKSVAVAPAESGGGANGNRLDPT